MTPTATRMREHAGRWAAMFAADAAIAVAEGLAALSEYRVCAAAERFDAAMRLWLLSTCEARDADAAWASASPAAQAIILGWLMEAEEASK